MPAAPLGTRPAAGEDAGRGEIFGERRKPYVPPYLPRMKTELMPYVDTASAMSLQLSSQLMDERGLMLPSSDQMREVAMNMDDGSSPGAGGRLRTQPPPRRPKDPEVVPFNDGSPSADMVAVVHGRSQPVQTRLHPGAGLHVQQSTSRLSMFEREKQYQPPRRPQSDILPAKVIAAHPYKEGFVHKPRHRNMSDVDEVVFGRDTDGSANGPGPLRGPDEIWDCRRQKTDVTAMPPPPDYEQFGRGDDDMYLLNVSNRIPESHLAADFRKKLTDATGIEGTNPHSQPELYSKMHDFGYQPPSPAKRQIGRSLEPPVPCKPADATGVDPKTSMGGHADHTPWPSHVRRPIRESDATILSDTANRERHIARARRQREANGLAPLGNGEMLGADTLPAWVNRKGSTDGGDWGPRDAKLRNEREKRLLGVVDSSARYSVPNTDIHGPLEMRRQHGLWARLHASASAPLIDTHGHYEWRSGERATSEELEHVKQQLREKIFDKFRTAQKAFRTIDEDASGALSYDEIVAAVRHFNLPITDAHVWQLCEQADVNGDGEVDYEEFANALMLLHDSGGVIDVASRESTDDTKGGLKRTGDDLIGAAANQSSVDPWSGGSLF